MSPSLNAFFFSTGLAISVILVPTFIALVIVSLSDKI